MLHHRKDFNERAAEQRRSGACEKQPDDLVIICPECGERSYYFMSDEYICKLAGHSYNVPAGIFIRYGDMPAVKAMILSAQASDAYARECAVRNMLHATMLVNPDRFHRTTAENQFMLERAGGLS